LACALQAVGDEEGIVKVGSCPTDEAMDTTLFDHLLYEEESTTLDFKKEQYRFIKATDEEKSELLKDILGFANAWRRAEAYILIGVEEVRGGRSIVAGVTEQLQDHALQQFVNSLTNRPLQFGYEAFEFEGKQVGVIRIEQQRRPIFLRKDYGKLQKERVYVRRGSSTDPTKPAGPDEIATMGSEQSAGMQRAFLTVGFADTEQEVTLGERIKWKAELCRMPDYEDIPTIKSPRLESPYNRVNTDYFHDLAKYERITRLCRKVPASDVRIEIKVPTSQPMFIMSSSKFPRVPETRKGPYLAGMDDLRVRQPFRSPGDLEIEQTQHEFKIEVECGNLQPGRKVWSDVFYVGIARSGEAHLVGCLLAANLPGPQDFTLTLDAEIVDSEMTINELVSLGDSIDE
jgi:hypothetical protein